MRRGLPSRRLAPFLALLPALLLAGSLRAQPAPLDRPLELALPAQALGITLRELARDADLQILFDPALVAGVRGLAIRGRLTPRAALALLLKDSPLEAHESGDGIIVIRRRSVAQVPRSPMHATASVHPEDAGTLGEVIVTSQRRAERLQDVPLSVAAFERRALEVRGARSIDDIARLAPGVTFSRGRNYNSESSEISIRGIGSSAGAATTGVYIDETPIQSRHLSFGTYNAYPTLFDIERVEVLRGPQGTLFGAGSEGGTVRFITPEPSRQSMELYARAEAATTAHGAASHEYGGAVGLPTPDGRAALRLSASDRREGGYVDRIDWHAGRVAAANANAAVTRTARLALAWVPADGVEVSPSVFHQQRRVSDTAAWWDLVPGAVDPTGGQFDRALRNGNAIANPSDDDFTLWALRVNATLGTMRLTSSTSLFDRRQSAVSDYAQYDRAVFLDDPFPPPGILAPTAWADVQQNWTQEIRLESATPGQRVAWTAGLFAQRARENTVENVFDPSLVAQLGFPVYRGGYLYYQDPFRSIDTQLALFGQADVRLDARFNLTLGLRLTHARFEGEAFFAGPVVGTPVGSRGRISEDPVTPKLGLSYSPRPDQLFYVSLAKGYRIGGANPAVGRLCYGGADSALGSIGLAEVPSGYASDTVWSYEAGAKLAAPERRWLLDASAYLIRWQDIQQSVPLTACGFQFTANLGRAQSRGFDLQMQWRPGELSSAGVALGFTDAVFSRTVRLAPAALSLVQRGDHLPVSPWTASAFAEMQRHLRGWLGYARLDLQYAARQRDPVPTTNPANGGDPGWFTGIPAQAYLNLRLGGRIAGWDLALSAQNLLDRRPRLTVNQDVGLGRGGTPLLSVISSRPRTLAVSATYRY